VPAQQQKTSHVALPTTYHTAAWDISTTSADSCGSPHTIEHECASYCMQCCACTSAAVASYACEAERKAKARPARFVRTHARTHARTRPFGCGTKRESIEPYCGVSEYRSLLRYRFSTSECTTECTSAPVVLVCRSAQLLPWRPARHPRARPPSPAAWSPGL
jgi:hypothetical protein